MEVQIDRDSQTPIISEFFQINTIIESLITFNNVEPYTCHKPLRAKRPKNIVRKETVENPLNFSEEVARRKLVLL